MINYSYQTEVKLKCLPEISTWVSASLQAEKFKEGELDYIFCTDDFLAEINLKCLKHSTLTDIITFDYSLGKTLSAEIYISIDRVTENAEKFKVSFSDELNRVMIHGVLHLCGYKDNSKTEKELMRQKEDYYLSLRTFQEV